MKKLARDKKREEALRAKFFADHDFVEGTKRSLGYSGPGITLEELRAKIREKVDAEKFC